MQAPKGPRGRGRGRGASRAAASPRSNSDDENNRRAGRKVRFTGTSGGAPVGAVAPTSQPKTQAGPPSFHDKLLRNDQFPNNTHQANGLSSNALARAEGALADKAWRDPTLEDTVLHDYNKRMSELYQTVCFPLPCLLTREACSDILRSFAS